jgi:hypothetical protein
MAHTFTKNHLHAVFSTKERLKVIPEDFSAAPLEVRTSNMSEHSSHSGCGWRHAEPPAPPFFTFPQAAGSPVQCESSRKILQNG